MSLNVLGSPSGSDPRKKRRPKPSGAYNTPFFVSSKSESLTFILQGDALQPERDYILVDSETNRSMLRIINKTQMRKYQLKIQMDMF